MGVTELPALKLYGKIYGRNYSVITEKSECGKLRFYTTIESWYGTNRFMVTVRKRNGNFSMTPTVHIYIHINIHINILYILIPWLNVVPAENV